MVFDFNDDANKLIDIPNKRMILLEGGGILVYNLMKEFDKHVNSNIESHDILEIECDTECKLKILPNSTSYKVGHIKFNKPFYLQLDDCFFEESVAVELSLEQAIKLRDFLNNKIERIIQINS